jgi:hypothetical protein
MSPADDPSHKASNSTYNRGKINPEYTIYSQDLPDWE